MELKFTSIPSNNQLRLAVEAAGLAAYRFTGCSLDRLTYTVEPVDLKAEETKHFIKPNSDTWTVPVTLTCRNCKAQYKGWQVLPKKWYDNGPYWFGTEHCPQCPPVSIDVWLIQVGIQKEKPAEVIYQPKKQLSRLTLTLMAVEADEFE